MFYYVLYYLNFCHCVEDLSHVVLSRSLSI